MYDGITFPDWAQADPRRRAHVERVAGLLDEWARTMRVSDDERRRWLRAAYLHDALRDAPAAELERLAGPNAGWGKPKLRHGPAAAGRAEAAGEHDRGILDAVRYHSVGYAEWDDVGRMLYLADYLEPGRPHHEQERRAYASRVPSEPRQVLREVAAERLAWAIRSGWPLAPETVDFWNSLV